MDAPSRPPEPRLSGGAPEIRDVAALLRRNVEAMRAQRTRDEAAASLGHKLARRVAAFMGSLLFLGLQAALVATWVAVNLGWIPGVTRFDRSFVILATTASVEAIFLSTFLLISQNRIAAAADKRADLDLQINLLAEYEITQLVKITTRIAERLDIADARDQQLEDIAEEVAPETVLRHLETEPGAAAEAPAPDG